MHVVALDVGGTTMKGALLDHDGGVAHTAARPTDRDRGPDAVVAGIVDFAAELAATAGARFGTEVGAAAVVVPGLVDEPAGIASYSANIGWRDVPLRTMLAERLGVPVALGHDVRAGALAEARWGAGRGHGSFLFLPIGTGLAAAIVLDGKVVPGTNGCAGELGHLHVAPHGDPCECGARGCLETLASASAIARRYTAEGGRGAVTAEDVARLAGRGDRTAAKVWDEAVAALADGLAAGTRILDPPLVVLGGGLSGAGETLLAPLRTALAERLTFQPPPRVVIAELGHRAGCLGAGLLAIELGGDRGAS
ncbi:ROK family protein [Amycolatopsis methanolica]|uniref:Sugar kinase n=1 Tax=Amycolatopsis methanolica 239 TaxID=1068978 RepID=A0A076N4J8_AMYME|nr:ROK family protein [Amycolatopsis methanolica]AIJ26211.1 sugar kinase [Amycolatopsis methanolica 239]